MNEHDEIGGYFELELPKGTEYHSNAARFNTARNALKFFLLQEKVEELYVPIYIGDTVLVSIRQTKIKIHYYKLDEHFNPVLDPENLGHAYILLINYFGICEKVIQENCKKFKNVICDNAQAFYSNPEPGTVTIYSPRKFFGVADGGYIYADNLELNKIIHDDSTQRYMARLVRIDGGAEAGSFLLRNTEELLNRAKIRRMSTLTQKILSSIRYDEVWEKREDNFKFLHKNLKKINGLKINLRSVHGPMVYPFLFAHDDLRKYLIQNKIHVPQYWPEVSFRSEPGSFEYVMVNKLCPLPIDQRYSTKEMKIILELIESFLDKNRHTDKKSPINKLPEELEVNSSS